jgi:hypothetical protein
LVAGKLASRTLLAVSSTGFRLQKGQKPFEMIKQSTAHLPGEKKMTSTTTLRGIMLAD